MLIDWLSIAAICVGAEWVGSFCGTYGVGPGGAVAHGKVNNVDAVNKVNLWSPGVAHTPQGPVGFVENITSLEIGIKGRHISSNKKQLKIVCTGMRKTALKMRRIITIRVDYLL